MQLDAVPGHPGATPSTEAHPRLAVASHGGSSPRRPAGALQTDEAATRGVGEATVPRGGGAQTRRRRLGDGGDAGDDPRGSYCTPRGPLGGPPATSVEYGAAGRVLPVPRPPPLSVAAGVAGVSRLGRGQQRRDGPVPRSALSVPPPVPRAGGAHGSACPEMCQIFRLFDDGERTSMPTAARPGAARLSCTLSC